MDREGVQIHLRYVQHYLEFSVLRNIIYHPKIEVQWQKIFIGGMLTLATTTNNGL